MKFLLLPSIGLLALIAPLDTPQKRAPASEQEDPWSFSAIAASPTDDAVQNDLYDKLIGRLLFKKGKTGNAPFFCPVTRMHGRVIHSLELTYRDGDGAASGGTVTAMLKRVERSTGRVDVVLTVTSDGRGSLVDERRSRWMTRTSSDPEAPRFDHEIDLRGFYYYVQINLKRTKAAVAVGALGVRLQ